MDFDFSLPFLKRAIMHAGTGGGEPESRLVYQHHPSSDSMEMSVDLWSDTSFRRPPNQTRSCGAVCVYKRNGLRLAGGLGNHL